MHTLRSFSRRRTPVLSSSGKALLPLALAPFVVAPLPLPLAPFPLACSPNNFTSLPYGQIVLRLAINSLNWYQRLLCTENAHPQQA